MDKVSPRMMIIGLVVDVVIALDVYKKRERIPMKQQLDI